MKIEVRGDNVIVPEHTRQIIEKRCRFAFGRIVGEVAGVRVVVRDVNGPRRGEGIECSAGVLMRRGGEIRAEASDGMVQRAAELALERAARAAHRMLARRQHFRRCKFTDGLPEAG